MKTAVSTKTMPEDYARGAQYVNGVFSWSRLWLSPNSVVARLWLSPNSVVRLWLSPNSVVAMLPTVARVLATSIEELLGEGRPGPGKRGPAPKLQRQFEQNSHLPRAKQRFLIDMIEAVIRSGDKAA
ncbi:MAG TPA: hypothetical protein PKZ76_03720 [Xanthomonadaceae bacterium]|nr:hypothetical protein [Xanthomonadaceae bacterium]